MTDMSIFDKLVAMLNEFHKLLMSSSAYDAIKVLLEGGVMQQWLNDAVVGTKYEGELSPWNMGQNSLYHVLTLDQHTLETLKHAVMINSHAPLEKQCVMRLTAVCHDLGKMFQSIQRPTESGSVSYHGHEVHSAVLAELFLKHLGLEQYIPQVKPLVRHHMRPHDLVKNPSTRAIRRFLADLEQDEVYWADLLNQAEADVKGKTVDYVPAWDAYLGPLNVLRSKISGLAQGLE